MYTKVFDTSYNDDENNAMILFTTSETPKGGQGADLQKTPSKMLRISRVQRGFISLRMFYDLSQVQDGGEF